MKPLWRVSILTSPEAEDATSQLLGEIFQEPAVVYHDFETDNTVASLFLRNSAHFSRHKAQLMEGLRHLRKYGLRLPNTKVTCQKLRTQDWAESWKRHFKPIEIGRTLLIKPSWSRRRAKPSQAVIILDPGLSFGTGQHPTTSFCLRELARFSARQANPGFLDAGTGSGILAIAAAKLGFSPVDAFDFDTDALKVARANARRNRSQSKIHLFHGDATKFRSQKQYSMICANLSTDALHHAIRPLAACLQRDGVLVLAGILKSEFVPITQLAAKAGLQLLRRLDEEEWTSGSFVKCR